MKVIAIVPGTTDVHLADRPEPRITAQDELKMQVLQVGICGTDREEASGGRAFAPHGQKDLVMGHEMFGQVVEIGGNVTRVRVGDYAVLTVRRGCDECVPCLMRRPDMCRTGHYLERGIKGLDGYQSEYVVDKEEYAVRVPPELQSIGVLCEPLSVAEKAIDEAVRLQTARLPDAAVTPDWLFGRHCLIAGLGPVGLLAALVLRLRGAKVYGLDIVDPGSARPNWLAGIGGEYVDGRLVPPDKVTERLGSMDMIFEATGVPGLAFNLLEALDYNGVYVLTGIPGGDRPVQVPGAELIRRLVLNNHAMVGSVNAARDHFQMAADDLSHAHLMWKDLVGRLITHRHPYTEFRAALSGHGTDEIKVVTEWTAPLHPQTSEKT